LNCAGIFYSFNSFVSCILLCYPGITVISQRRFVSSTRVSPSCRSLFHNNFIAVARHPSCYRCLIVPCCCTRVAVTYGQTSIVRTQPVRIVYLHCPAHLCVSHQPSLPASRWWFYVCEFTIAQLEFTNKYALSLPTVYIRQRRVLLYRESTRSQLVFSIISLVPPISTIDVYSGIT